MEIREESSVLRKENQKLKDDLLDAKGKTLSLSRENEELKEELSVLRETANWGHIIREKNEELKRLQEFIRKMTCMIRRRPSITNQLLNKLLAI